MTPTEALDQAAEYVARIRGPRFLNGTPADNTHAALAVAAFLLGADVDETGEDDETGDEPPRVPRFTERVPLGPARKVFCAMSAGDYAYARAGKTHGVLFVQLEVTVDGEASTVFLSPRDARAFAAGLLDCADDADGASPAVWDLLNKGKGDDDGSAPTPATV